MMTFEIAFASVERIFAAWQNQEITKDEAMARFAEPMEALVFLLDLSLDQEDQTIELVARIKDAILRSRMN